MAIEFTCGCGRKLRVKDTFAGKRARCPHCGSVSLVPDVAGGKAATTPSDPHLRDQGPTALMTNQVPARPTEPRAPGLPSRHDTGGQPVPGASQPPAHDP